VSNTLLPLLLASFLPGGFDQGAETLVYRGKLVHVTRSADPEPVRQFELFCLLSHSENDSHRLGFLIDERGNGGGWPWPERFGSIDFDQHLQPAGNKRIRLLHDFKDSRYPIEIRLPVFEKRGTIAVGDKWVVGKREYEVVGEKNVGDYRCWKIDVSTNFGHVQTLWVDQQKPLLVKVEQKVTIGQGDEFQLNFRLDAASTLTPEEFEAIEAPLAALLDLQSKLRRGENNTRPELSSEQIELANGAIEALSERATSTPFEKFVATAARDIKAQMQRGDDLASLAKKQLGRELPKFELKSLAGKPVTSAELKGKVTVFHFWRYRDKPLAEPYGQIGYLDFLFGKRGKLGLAVFGIAVDERFADVANAPAAKRSARKLKEFMNLSYPVAFDSGALLRKLGDPRRLGTKLPLWVVVDSDGKIAHYHAGLYDVRADEGLSELDDVVVELLRARQASKSK